MLFKGLDAAPQRGVIDARQLRGTFKRAGPRQRKKAPNKVPTEHRERGYPCFSWGLSKDRAVGAAGLHFALVTSTLGVRKVFFFEKKNQNFYFFR
jgi:hypothetical protein